MKHSRLAWFAIAAATTASLAGVGASANELTVRQDTTTHTISVYRAGVAPIVARGDTVKWSTVYLLLDAAGQAILAETQNWTMRDHGNRYVINLEWKGEGLIVDQRGALDLAHPYYAPTETNVDAWASYQRKIWSARINWKVQLNVRNLYGDRGRIPVGVQPWGAVSVARLAPESRWYLTNSFGF